MPSVLQFVHIRMECQVLPGTSAQTHWCFASCSSSLIWEGLPLIPGHEVRLTPKYAILLFAYFIGIPDEIDKTPHVRIVFHAFIQYETGLQSERRREGGAADFR